MSDAPEEKPAKKSKPLLKILMMAGGALVLLSAGVGGGIYASTSGLVGGAHEKGGKTAALEGHGPAPEQKDEDGDGKFDTTYFEMKKEFTSNLLDPNRYIQVGLGVATTYGEKVTGAVEKNDPAIRSAVLGILAEQTADQMASIDGKEALQRQLRGAINKTLEAKTGFGGVSQVYFTSFVIQ